RSWASLAAVFPAVSGRAACSSASWCSGTPAGVVSAAAPGAKLNPVITPLALTVTSAVACCHHGLLVVLIGSPLPVAGYGCRFLAVIRRTRAGWRGWPGPE